MKSTAVSEELAGPNWDKGGKCRKIHSKSPRSKSVLGWSEPVRGSFSVKYLFLLSNSGEFIREIFRHLKNVLNNLLTQYTNAHTYTHKHTYNAVRNEE